MLRSRRVKRASVTDLYKSCKLGGDCIPDVQNKVEGTTLADRLLTIFGSILYLGHLGIGTGKGSGGFGGYGPLSGTAGRSPSVNVPRPTIPVDPLGGAEVIPLDVINPEAPAIIPLTDGLPNVPNIDSSTPAIDVAELDVTTDIKPTDTLTTSNQQPTIITSGTDVQIVDFQPGPPPPKRIVLDVGLSTAEELELNVFSEPKNFDPNINVFVDPNITGQTVGFEEIELEPFNPDSYSEFEVDEAGPTTSTPTQYIEGVVTKGRRFYNRIVKQVPTRNPEFISRPSRLVRFEFENPAFEEDVTIQFEQDVLNVATAPDSDFQDIVSLSRPYLSETEGGVRVSRIGQKSTMVTRSGLRVGEKVHYFYDISRIPKVSDIELQTFGKYSNDSVNVDALSETVFYDGAEHSQILYSDDMLQDPLEERFENAHLVLTAFGANERLEVPNFAPGVGLKIFLPDISKNITIDFPQYTPEADTTYIVPNTDLIPSSTTYSFDNSYALHPDLMRRRRKRKYVNV